MFVSALRASLTHREKPLCVTRKLGHASHIDPFTIQCQTIPPRVRFLCFSRTYFSLRRPGSRPHYSSLRHRSFHARAV